MDISGLLNTYSKVKMIKNAIIFCGGKGKRLKPITNKIPKPMVTIKKKPFLEILIYQLLKVGVKNIYLLTGYRSNIIKSYFERLLDQNNHSFKIFFIKSNVNFETGTRLKLLTQLKIDKFYLCYADNLVNLNFTKYINFHKISKKYTVVVQKKTIAKEKGNIKFDKNKLAFKYLSKRSKDLSHVELGYFILDQKIFSNLKLLTGNFSFNKIINLLIDENKLVCYETSGKYLSITNLKTLNSARKDIRKFRIYDLYSKKI